MKTTTTASTASPVGGASSPVAPLSEFKVAVLQLNTQSDTAANVAPTLALIREAAQNGAQFIVTPENTSRMGSGQATDDSNKVQQYVESEHPSIHAYKQCAAELKIWLCIGSVHVKCDQYSLPSGGDSSVCASNSDLLSNRCLLFNDRGETVARYDKIHMFDVPNLNAETKESYLESARFRPGSRAVLVRNTPFGNIGLTICYDVRFSSLYQQLAKAGADLIVVAAAFTCETGALHWHVLNRARAIENGCHILAAAQGGTHDAKRQTYGHSLIIDPLGQIRQEADHDRVAVLYETIQHSAVAAARRKIPSLANSREFKLDIIEANALVDKSSA